MNTKPTFRTFAVALTMFGFLIWADMCLAAPQQLQGNVPAATASLQPKGPMERSEHLHLAIGLPLRDQAGLSNLFAAIYNPASPEFHRYLTPEQFTERFGPSQADYQALQDFVNANGLTVTATHSNRVVLDVDGTVPAIEKMLHVSMQIYDHPTEARTFYAPDREPSLDLAVPILDISGLDNFHVAHPKLILSDIDGARDKNPEPKGGSGPGGNYLGKDFRQAYLPGITNLTGVGQSVGLLELDGFYAKDMTNYANAARMTVPTIITVPVNGGVPTNQININAGNGECSLDIEMVMAMASNATIYVYEDASFQPADWVDILSAMVTNTACKQFSCSWAISVEVPSAETLFMQMAMQGQSFFNAAGDQDSFLSSTAINWPGFPTDSPNITQVGGTILSTTNGVYESETVWNTGVTNSHGGYLGSSGGYATDTLIPIYQAGISNAANLASTNNRNVPDVALTAANISINFGNGSAGMASGTSCAAPLWAGFMANANQEAARLGKPSAGFINPAIYALGQGLTYTGSFHDITNGNNEWHNNPTNFPAVTGYDLATGWGTPTGMHTINALIGLDSPIGLAGDVWVNQSSTCKVYINPDCTSGTGPATNMTTALTFVTGPNGGTLFLNATGHISRIAQQVGIRAVNGPARIQP